MPSSGDIKPVHNFITALEEKGFAMEFWLSQ